MFFHSFFEYSTFLMKEFLYPLIQNIFFKDDMLKWLKYYREKSGLSMSKLSELIGVQLNTIWRWENERASPSVEMAKGLAKIFGITESELLNGPASQTWELRLLVNKAGKEKKGDTVDMSGGANTAVMNLSDDAMVITLSAGYSLWEDNSRFEALIDDLRRKRQAGLKMRKENW